MSGQGYELTGLAGKVAVVTGAGRMRSIGRAIALELARAGCDVVVTGSGATRRPSPEESSAGWRDVESVADEVGAMGRRSLAMSMDVTDAGGVAEAADRVVAEMGRVDVVVNNASAARGPDQVPVLDLDPAVFEHLLRVNTTGTMLVSQAFARHMVAQGDGGAMVNISSISAKTADANFAAYAASKAGVLALTSCMAKELAGHGIRVNAVCPGLIETQRVSDIWSSGRAETYIQRSIPLGRAGQGIDVASTVVFLCSDGASWVTGQQWNVDGGQVTTR